MTTIDRPRTTTTVQMPVGPFTLDDWINLAQQDSDHRYELVNGSIIIMTPPPSNHAVVVSELSFWLASHYGPRLVLADAGLAVGENGRVPDLMVLRRTVANVPYLHPGDVLLAVEVVSPNSRHDDRKVKPVEYANGGVEHYWRVEGCEDPDTATVSRFHLEEDHYAVVAAYERLTDLVRLVPVDVLAQET